MDIIERLKIVESAEREVALGMDMRPEDTANYAYAETCHRAVAEIERLTAENERLRADVAAFIAAWDSLPVGGHSVRAVQDWINSPALKSSVIALKAFQQLSVNSEEGK